MRWFAWFVCFIAWAVPLYAQKDSLPMYYTFPNLKQESPAWATPQQREALQTLAQMKQKLAYLEARNDQKEMAMLAHRIGVECDKQADYPSALQFFLKSLKIRQLLQDQKGIASSLNSIGIVYQNQDDYHKALAYFQQSLDIKQKIGDKIGMSTTLNNIGIAYRKLKNYDKALASYQQSLQIREFAQDKRLIAMSLSNIATVYEHQQKYALALEYYQKSIQIKEELQDKLGLIFSLQGLANIYREQQQYAPSIVCAEKALLLAIAEKSYREVSISAEQLYKAYKLNAEYDKALRYHELYKKTQDSIFSIDKTRLIAKLETDMAMEKQQQIIEKHAKDLEIAQKQADADRMKNLAQEEMHKHRTDVLQGIAQKTRLETERLKAEKKASTLEMQKHKEEKEFQRVILYLILLGLMGAVSAVWVIFRSKRKEQKANAELRVAIDTVSLQKKELEYKKQAITDSINYAKRIQTTILPPREVIEAVLPESFIFFQPRDIVSGDFYFLEQVEHKIVLSAIDCTGHGVPGALMSMLGKEILDQIIQNQHITEPDIILNELHKGIRKALKQTQSTNRDGMEMAIVVIDKNERVLHFAGAKNPLIYIQNQAIHHVKGDRKPIGGEQREAERIFTRHTISLPTEETMFYMFSDGFQDQFGGLHNKKITTERMKDLFFDIYALPVAIQQTRIEHFLQHWIAEGNAKQMDDILVIGFRL